MNHIPREWFEQVKLRHEELSRKGWDWKSFYNGALEGFNLAYLMGLFSDDKCSEIKRLENENAGLRERLEEAANYIHNQGKFYSRVMNKLDEWDEYLVDEKMEIDKSFLSKLKKDQPDTGKINTEMEAVDREYNQKMGQSKIEADSAIMGGDPTI